MHSCDGVLRESVCECVFTTDNCSALLPSSLPLPPVLIMSYFQFMMWCVCVCVVWGDGVFEGVCEKESEKRE